MTLISRWQQLYNEAVLESDWSRMEERIEAAESAIKSTLNHGETPEENQAIVNALGKLSILRADLASWRIQKGEG